MGVRTAALTNQQQQSCNSSGSQHRQHNQRHDNFSSSHYNNKLKRNRGSSSVVVTLAAIAVTILCLFITQCDANISANNNNAASQQQAATNLLDVKPVNYSVWKQNVTYLSSSAFNARGMAPLYNISNTIINLFVDDEEPIPRGK